MMLFVHRTLAFSALWLMPFILLPVIPRHAAAAPPIEFCEQSPLDKQLRASKGKPSADTAACSPLIEKKDSEQHDARTPRKATGELKIENLQAEVVGFLQKYHQFLECCRTDITELERVEELGDEVNELLAIAQSGLFSEQVKLRGWTIAELLPPVARARADLKKLRTRLETIGSARDKLDQLDYESSAKELRAIQEAEDAIRNDFQTRPLPTGPKTGTGIGASSTVGPSIGKTPKTGTDIGSAGALGADVGAAPRAGGDIGNSGPTGFDIGATGRAGAAIGESSLNREQSAVGSSLQPSTVGSSLGDSTIGSSLGGSTIGSELGDTTVGSSLGGSSVGSSLQNRGTAPQ